MLGYDHDRQGAESVFYSQASCILPQIYIIVSIEKGIIFLFYVVTEGYRY